MLTLKIYQKVIAVTILFKEITLIKIKNDSLHEEKGTEDLSNKVVIIGHFMLNNFNSRGSSKSKEVDVLKFPGATSADVFLKNPHP